MRYLLLPVALFIQVIFMFLYPALYSLWKSVVYRKKAKTIPVHEDPKITAKHSTMRDGCFHNNEDDHGAFTHVGLFVARPDLGRKALELLVTPDGRFVRKYEVGKVNTWCPSGDVVVFWCFAFALLPDEMKPIDALERAVKSYMKNLGALGTITDNQAYDVSKRSGNFGALPYGDGWSGPAAGPQYYTTACLLALAAKHLGIFWRLVFWAHWAIYGGWYWAKWPVLYPGNLMNWLKWIYTFGIFKGEKMPDATSGEKLGYVRDVSMKALWIMKQCMGSRSWIEKPMRFINDTIGESESALFNYMMGREIEQHLPDVLDVGAWQRIDSVSIDGRGANIWTLDALNRVKELSIRG